jgi:hypothetical protein
MDSIVQLFAEKIKMSFDEFVGEMRKRGCSEPTAIKVWRGEYEKFSNFNDHDISLSNLRKAADVLNVQIGWLFPDNEAGNLLDPNQGYMLIKPKGADHLNSLREKKYEYKIQD